MRAPQNRQNKPKLTMSRVVPILLPVITFVAITAQSIAWAAISLNLSTTGVVRVRSAELPKIELNTASYPEHYNFEIFRGDTSFTPSSLKQRLVATDPNDGNITSSIYAAECKKGEQVVACPTTNWLAWEMGDYTIAYRAVNSAGQSSNPLIINVTIWQFIKLQNGQYYCVVLSSHGQVWTFGYNSSGSRGYGSSTSSASSNRAPTRIVQSYFNNEPVVDIAAGYASGYAVTTTGKGYAWGDGSDYQLGNNSNSNQTTPVAITMPAGVAFKQISAFYHTGAALGYDGNIYTWGDSSSGASGSGNTTTKRTASAITSSGNFKQVAQGTNFGAGVTTDGQVYVWGSSGDGQAGNGSTSGSSNPPTLVKNLSDITQVGAGARHVAAINSSGQVYVWGNNGSGRLGLGNTTTRSTPVLNPNVSGVTQVSLGYDFTNFRTDSDVWSSGSSDYGELFEGVNTNRQTPVKSSLTNIAGNVGFVSGRYDNAHILSVNGTMSYGVGFANSIGQEFGSTLVQDTTYNYAVPWAFTALVNEW